MFGWEFPPLITGGLGVACFGLSKGLAKQGVKITFVVPRYIERAPRFIKLVSAQKFWDREVAHRPYTEADLIPYFGAYSRPDYETWDDETASTGLTNKPIYGPDLFRSIELYARAGQGIASRAKFDIIHCHDWMTYPAGIAVKKITGRPLVLHVHSIERDRSVFGNPHIVGIEQAGLNAADLIMCVSRYTLEQVKKVYKIPESKMMVVYNGIDIPLRSKPALREHPDGRHRTVLSLGRITWQKGTEYFVDTAQMMLARNRRLRFVLAGWGDKAPELIERTATLYNGAHILYAGFLDEDEVRELLRRTDLFLMPSRSEPFGLVALEALSQGVPIIISRQSGVAELLEAVPKVDYWDTAELARCSLELLNSRDLAREQIEKSWPVLKSLNWERAGKTCFGGYKRVLEGTAA